MKKAPLSKIIVAVAPVGKNVSPPSINPLTPQKVAEEVIRCARAGASMVHLHVRDEEGNPTGEWTAFSKTLDLIRKKTDILIQGSTGGVSTLSLEERCVSLNDPWVEVASLNMGSANIGESVYINTLPDIRYWARRMSKARVIPELEIFEAGMIPEALELILEKSIPSPFYFNFCFGFHWAIPARPDCLLLLKSLLPEGIPFGVVHDGMKDFSFLAAAVGMGASIVRVGFEDSVYYRPDRAAQTNVELVERIVSLIRQIGFDAATPDEARKILKTRNRTASREASG